MASIRRLDPSRTGMIRRRFISELNKRFNKLIKAIYTEIVTDDVFGLLDSEGKSQAQKAGLQTLQYRAYQFLTTPQKMRAFQNWLQIQIDTGILSVSGGITGQPWTGTYIESAYKKAAMDAYVDANKKDLLRSAGWIQGSRESFLRTAFAQPEMLSKIELLSTRAFQQLQGITATMSQQISVSLANGLSHGWSPLKIARDIQKTVSDINRVRARRIARTEIINAHAEGQLDAFEQMGFKEVGVIAELEFTTAGDALVCETCAGLEGQTYSIDDARGIIPVHPNCVLPDSMVDINDSYSITKANYTGKIFNFVLSSGCNISVTENHILLTEYGFVPAKFIYKGLNLINTSDRNWISIISPNYNSNEVMFSEAFTSFQKNSGMRLYTLPVCPENFHNEGRFIDSKIDIILLNSELRNNRQFGLNTEFIKHSFPSTRELIGRKRHLATNSPISKFFPAILTSFDSSMGFFRDALSFSLGCILHAIKHGFASISWDDIIIPKSSVDNSPRNREFFCQTFNAHPILKQVNNLSNGNFDSQIFRTFYGDRNINSFKSFFESVAFNSINLSDRKKIFSGQVPLDNVVNIDIFHCSTPVYDLSTFSTLYTINGIIGSNCRCSWTPVDKT